MSLFISAPRILWFSHYQFFQLILLVTPQVEILIVHLHGIGNVAVRFNVPENYGFRTNIGRFRSFFTCHTLPPLPTEMLGVLAARPVYRQCICSSTCLRISLSQYHCVPSCREMNRCPSWSCGINQFRSMARYGVSLISPARERES